MGTLKPCLSISESSGSYEIAVLALYDEPSARVVTPTNPGFDDRLGEPRFSDQDDDSIGERTRPENVVEIRAKAKWSRADEQNQDGTGNLPNSLLVLTVLEKDLKSKGLLIDGVLGIRPNDRLLRLQNGAGVIRHDFEQGGRDGLFVYEVRPGETGTGILTILLEDRRVGGQ